MGDGQYNYFSGTTSYRIVPFLHQYTERVQMNLIFSYFNNYDKFNSNNNGIVMITITTAIQLRNIGEKRTEYVSLSYYSQFHLYWINCTHSAF